MSIESRLSGHWTDDQLLEHLYGLGPADEHVLRCQECSVRLSAMLANRRRVESNANAGDTVSRELLDTQRRSIYARLSKPVPWFPFRRWASVVATVLVLGGSTLLYQHKHQQSMDNQISDVQLAQDVSSMALDSEPQSTAPLQALFEE